MRQNLLGLLLSFAAIDHALGDGAIAFGQWGNGGAAWMITTNRATTAEAQAAAMIGCNSHGYNCAIRQVFKNTCAALAVQFSDYGFGYDFDHNSNLAEQKALARCHSYGLPCRVVASHCDTTDEAVDTPITTPAPGGTACERFPNLC
jgi:hypothetical protein